MHFSLKGTPNLIMMFSEQNKCIHKKNTVEHEVI